MTNQPIETVGNRQTVVVSIDMFPNATDGLLNFSDLAKKMGIETDQFWIVMITTRHGSLPLHTESRFFEKKLDAQNFFKENPIGTVQDDPRNIAEFLKTKHGAGFIEKIFDDPDSPINFLGVPGEDGQLPWQVLKDAGLSDGYSASPKVLDYLGPERVLQIKSIHGENWQVVAEMEFCFSNLPSSSSAYVAAQRQYNYYITQDDFAAGYLQRDLEILVHGVERAAQRANDYSQRQSERAAKGGEAVAQKAELRRTTFFKLALSVAASWVWKSESEQRRFLKGLALEHDQSTGEDLFKRGTKTLSDQWFDEALSSLRQSGALEAVFSGKP
ncbi:hypothetical protein KL867_09890 [Ruegeria litorea]|uniref:Uncharacterized protein n=1 Tax=Falsiruegeria litorea TaxID=1280831 RepID=A0ABS5WQE1_9RHOB|nr:hypothetical protein [Falsiruegeria litorea]MBT3141363.1 hypothetical protein [Falsiruegeria litorea]